MSGLTIVKPEEPATAFVADRRLGRTADKTRVVDYYSPEAAFGFKAPGQKVTVEEARQFGISAEHPFTPTNSEPGGIRTEPDGTEKPEPEAKAAEPPEDKAVKKADVEDKGLFRRRKKGEK